MKKRLLFLNNTLGCGGVERSLCDVLRHIDYTRYDVDLYLDSTEGGLFSQVPETVRIVYPNMDGCYGRFVPILKKLLKQKEYGKIYLRIIHKIAGICGYRAYGLAKPLFRKNGIYDCVISYKEGSMLQFAKRVFTARKYISWWHCASPSVTSSLFDGYEVLDKIVAVSPSALDVLHKVYPKAKNNTMHIDNMIDVNHILSLSENNNSKLDEYGLRLITVARLSPEKHLENIVVCAKELRNRGIKFVWDIVGGAPV